MKISVEYVERKVAEYNSLMFGGHLPPLPIRLSSARTFMGRLYYIKQRKLTGGWAYSDYKLIISTRFDLPEEIVEDTIIHELIHYHIMYNGLRDTSSHGPVFRDIMARINEKFHRHVTISVRLSEEVRQTDTRLRIHLVCISQMRNGGVGITVAARTRLLDLWDLLPQRLDVTRCTWYISNNAFFNRFPRSITPQIYRITQEEVTMNLADARPLVRHGNTVKAE